MFALVELLSALVFITLAIIFYLNVNVLNGDMMIPIIFASIGGCALIGAPVIFISAKRYEEKNPAAVEY